MQVGATFGVVRHVTEVLILRCQMTWKWIELKFTGGGGSTFDSCDLYEARHGAI